MCFKLVYIISLLENDLKKYEKIKDVSFEMNVYCLNYKITGQAKIIGNSQY